MGSLTLPAGGDVYVDTNSVIYRVEMVEPYLSASAPLWAALDAGLLRCVTSELSLLETLVKPLRDGNLELASLYRQVLRGTSGLSCLPIQLAVIESAARLRAAHRLRTPDAIHAATAMESGCVLFVTNDPDFRRVPGLNVAILGEIAAS